MTPVNVETNVTAYPYWRQYVQVKFELKYI